MSIGPNNEIPATPAAVEQVRMAFNRATKIFSRPAAALFYVGIAALMISLMLERDIAFPYYIVLVVLGAITGIQSLMAYPDEKEK